MGNQISVGLELDFFVHRCILATIYKKSTSCEFIFNKLLTEVWFFWYSAFMPQQFRIGSFRSNDETFSIQLPR